MECIHTHKYNISLTANVRLNLGPDSQTILGQTYDISYDNILWPIYRTHTTILRIS